MSQEQLLDQERAELSALKDKSGWERTKWYFSKSGPGWMQSAMTLGGGSAMASLFSGAALKYQLLWVQPVAMLIGVIMLSALAFQTLSRQTRPFEAMRLYVSPVIAWMWAIATILTTMVWHFPQYALASGMTLDIFKDVSGVQVESGSLLEAGILLGIAFVILIIAANIVWNYGKGGKGVKIFETVIKGIVWFIIFAFAAVVIVGSFMKNPSGESFINWGDVLAGFSPFSFEGGFHWNIPQDSQGISIFIASLSAAVGINMTFLFGYSFLKKKWTKDYVGLARFDLLTGMLVPYTIATSLMIIASGAMINGNADFDAANATTLHPIQAAAMFAQAGLPVMVSKLVFGLGIIGMAINAIILHMTVSGFAVCEIFKIEESGWKYKLATMLPVPGVLGAVLWAKMGAWIAIPTSAVALIVLPIAYLGFFLLNNSKKYLGDDMPRGKVRFWWNTGMILAMGVIVVSAVFYIVKVVPSYFTDESQVKTEQVINAPAQGLEQAAETADYQVAPPKE